MSVDQLWPRLRGGAIWYLDTMPVRFADDEAEAAVVTCVAGAIVFIAPGQPEQAFPTTARAPFTHYTRFECTWDRYTKVSSVKSVQRQPDSAADGQAHQHHGYGERQQQQAFTVLGHRRRSGVTVDGLPVFGVGLSAGKLASMNWVCPFSCRVCLGCFAGKPRAARS